MTRRQQITVVCLLLTTLTSIAFWQVTQCQFTNYDDPGYITANSHIQDGVTTEGIKWAFTADYASNWHPLTWISHMLDVQFFGLDPYRHHLVNLIFHIAATLLLFLVLHQMTKALWQSAFVAALFALHPLHVESVAWVSERKDVLSALFWMLVMAAYFSYATRPGLARWLIVLLCYALGLMSKPMLVSLPFVLILLDYWPLKRMAPSAPGNKNRKPKSVAMKEPPQGQWALIRILLLEKVPFLVLAALSSVITYVAQQQGGAIGSFEKFPLIVRLENAFVSYLMYIGKMLWPVHLAVLYPHPGSWPRWEVLGAVVLLAAVTAMVVWKAQRFPYLAVGWLWYLGTLVPVIGIVQVGPQGMADRYTYIPLIGLFIMAAWGVPELGKTWHYRKEALGALSALILVSLLMETRTQVGYWRTSITLFDHTLGVTHRNRIIHNNRGIAYNNLGNYKHAIEDFDMAVEIDPRYAEAYYNRGIAKTRLGDNRQAIRDFDAAIEISPRHVDAYLNRGNAFKNLGDLTDAIKNYDRAIEIDPEYAEVYINRGNAYNGLVNHTEAIRNYDKAIEIDPRSAEAYCNRGITFSRMGVYKQAIEDFDRAIKIKPAYPEAYGSRGIAYGRLGNDEQAIDDLRTAAQLGYREAMNFLRARRIPW